MRQKVEIRWREFEDEGTDEIGTMSWMRGLDGKDDDPLVVHHSSKPSHHWSLFHWLGARSTASRPIVEVDCKGFDSGFDSFDSCSFRSTIEVHPSPSWKRLG